MFSDPRSLPSYVVPRVVLVYKVMARQSWDNGELPPGCLVHVEWGNEWTPLYAVAV
ncbi:hypothetical protein C8Q74DRAFT_1249187 [Fomes fomentarius]|nr:hypothetical protein C8Q74DRAFT_1249187 [Fomes fomentarius]